MTAAALLWKYNLQYQYIFIALKMYVQFCYHKISFATWSCAL